MGGTGQWLQQHIVRAVQEGGYALVWNGATRRETQAILRRIPRLEWDEVALLFRPEWEYQGETHPEKFSDVPDPDDRKFAALAAASGATLVSNDRHLIAHRGAGFEASSPTELLQSTLNRDPERRQ